MSILSWLRGLFTLQVSQTTEDQTASLRNSITALISGKTEESFTLASSENILFTAVKMIKHAHKEIIISYIENDNTGKFIYENEEVKKATEEAVAREVKVFIRLRSSEDKYRPTFMVADNIAMVNNLNNGHTHVLNGAGWFNDTLKKF